MEHFVQFEDVSKYYQTGSVRIAAADHLNFYVDKGEFCIIVGPSGAGKTTLLNILGGMDTCDEGHVWLDGQDVSHFSEKELTTYRRYDVGFVFQFYNLVQNLTALENVELASEICRDPLDPAATLESVGLGERLNNFPAQLSGGEQQRVSIARALAKNPKLLLCDEPISALDVSIQAQVVNVLEDLQQELGLTYLFVAHDLSMVRHISDRIGVMYLGKIVESGESDEVYDNPCHPYTRALLASIPIADPKRALSLEHCGIEGDLPSPLHVPSGCRFHTRCPYATDQCRQQEPELEERTPGHMVACWKK